MIAALTVSVGAQEAVKPTSPPEKTKPPAAMTKEMKAAVQKAILEAKAKEKAPSRVSNRRVVLPPKATNCTTERPSPARVVPSTRQATKQAPSRVVQNSMRTVQEVGPSAAPEKPRVLTENITIQLQGSVYGSEPLDLSLTGVGPVFQADVIAGEDRSILTHQYSVRPNDCGYRVEYSIGLRIAMEVSRNGQATVSGAAIAKEGERVVISKNGAHELALTLGKAGKK